MFKVKPTFIQRVLLIGLLCMLLECLAVSIFAQTIVGEKNKLSEAQKTKAEMFFYEGLRLKALGDYRTAVINFDKVIAIDPREDARANALARGADFAFAPDDPDLKKHRGLNAAFDFAGVTPVRKQALSLLGEQGRLIIIGIASEPIVIPSDMAFTYMRTQIMGHYGSEAHHVRELVELARQGRLDLSHSISEILPLDQAAEAIDKLANKIDNPIRIVLKP